MFGPYAMSPPALAHQPNEYITAISLLLAASSVGVNSSLGQSLTIIASAPALAAVENPRPMSTYRYRRVWAMVNRTFRTGYNRKRIRRVMQPHGLMLAPRVHRRH